MKAALTFIGLVATAAAALPVEAPAQNRERITRVVIYGNDPCPVSETAIIVCARRPDKERYRIPRELRDTADANDPGNRAWAARAQSLEVAGRTGTQSCSTVGAGGFTGCWAELMRAARGDRRVEGEAGR